MWFFTKLACVIAGLQMVVGFVPTMRSVRPVAPALLMRTPGEVDAVPQHGNQLISLQSLQALRTIATATALIAPIMAATSVLAADDKAAATVEEPKVVLGPAPTDFGLKLTDYYDDCQKVVNHIRYAVQLEKGNPIIADFAGKTKEEMNDFVSFYRRFQGIQGRQSFSLLYTSINVLAGHYTSYGLKFPVPEKRRKRLLQEMLDIEKNIRKRR